VSVSGPGPFVAGGEEKLWPRALLDLETLEQLRRDGLPDPPRPTTLSWDDYIDSDMRVLAPYCKPESLQEPRGWLLPGVWPELTRQATLSVVVDLFGRAGAEARLTAALTGEGVEDGR
jgi:hypothetical protein